MSVKVELHELPEAVGRLAPRLLLLPLAIKQTRSMRAMRSHGSGSSASSTAASSYAAIASSKRPRSDAAQSCARCTRRMFSVAIRRLRETSAKMIAPAPAHSLATTGRLARFDWNANPAGPKVDPAGFRFLVTRSA